MNLKADPLRRIEDHSLPFTLVVIVVEPGDVIGVVHGARIPACAPEAAVSARGILASVEELLDRFADGFVDPIDRWDRQVFE